MKTSFFKAVVIAIIPIFAFTQVAPVSWAQSVPVQPVQEDPHTPPAVSPDDVEVTSEEEIPSGVESLMNGEEDSPLSASEVEALEKEFVSSYTSSDKKFKKSLRKYPNLGATNSDGTENAAYHEVMYDEQGEMSGVRLVKTIGDRQHEYDYVEQESGEILNTAYRYTQNEILITDVDFAPDQDKYSGISRVTTRYDAAGAFISEIHLDMEGAIVYQRRPGEQRSYSEQGMALISYTDENGNVIGRTEYYYRDGYTLQVERELDNDGKLAVTSGSKVMDNGTQQDLTVDETIDELEKILLERLDELDVDVTVLVASLSTEGQYPPRDDIPSLLAESEALRGDVKASDDDLLDFINLIDLSTQTIDDVTAGIEKIIDDANAKIDEYQDHLSEGAATYDGFAGNDTSDPKVEGEIPGLSKHTEGLIITPELPSVSEIPALAQAAEAARTNLLAEVEDIRTRIQNSNLDDADKAELIVLLDTEKDLQIAQIDAFEDWLASASGSVYASLEQGIQDLSDLTSGLKTKDIYPKVADVPGLETNAGAVEANLLSGVESLRADILSSTLNDQDKAALIALLDTQENELKLDIDKYEGWLNEAEADYQNAIKNIGEADSSVTAKEAGFEILDERPAASEIDGLMAKALSDKAEIDAQIAVLKAGILEVPFEAEDKSGLIANAQAILDEANQKADAYIAWLRASAFQAAWGEAVDRMTDLASGLVIGDTYPKQSDIAGLELSAAEVRALVDAEVEQAIKDLGPLKVTDPLYEKIADIKAEIKLYTSWLDEGEEAYANAISNIAAADAEVAVKEAGFEILDELPAASEIDGLVAKALSDKAEIDAQIAVLKTSILEVPFEAEDKSGLIAGAQAILDEANGKADAYIAWLRAGAFRAALGDAVDRIEDLASGLVIGDTYPKQSTIADLEETVEEVRAMIVEITKDLVQLKVGDPLTERINAVEREIKAYANWLAAGKKAYADAVADIASADDAVAVKETGFTILDELPAASEIDGLVAKALSDKAEIDAQIAVLKAGILEVPFDGADKSALIADAQAILDEANQKADAYIAWLQGGADKQADLKSQIEALGDLTSGLIIEDIYPKQSNIAGLEAGADAVREEVVDKIIQIQNDIAASNLSPEDKAALNSLLGAKKAEVTGEMNAYDEWLDKGKAKYNNLDQEIDDLALSFEGYPGDKYPRMAEVDPSMFYPDRVGTGAISGLLEMAALSKQMMNQSADQQEAGINASNLDEADKAALLAELNQKELDLNIQADDYISWLNEGRAKYKNAETEIGTADAELSALDWFDIKDVRPPASQIDGLVAQALFHKAEIDSSIAALKGRILNVPFSDVDRDKLIADAQALLDAANQKADAYIEWLNQSKALYEDGEQKVESTVALIDQMNDFEVGDERPRNDQISDLLDAVNASGAGINDAIEAAKTYIRDLGLNPVDESALIERLDAKKLEPVDTPPQTTEYRREITTSGGSRQIAAEMSLILSSEFDYDVLDHVNPLFDEIVLQGVPTGSAFEPVSMTATSENSDGFDAWVKLMTNGQSDYFVYENLYYPNGGGGLSSKLDTEIIYGDMTDTHPTDLQGQNITAIEVVINHLYMDAPGKDPNNDGQWTDYDLSFDIIIHVADKNASSQSGSNEEYIAWLNKTAELNQDGADLITGTSGSLDALISQFKKEGGPFEESIHSTMMMNVLQANTQAENLVNQLIDSIKALNVNPADESAMIAQANALLSSFNNSMSDYSTWLEGQLKLASDPVVVIDPLPISEETILTEALNAIMSAPGRCYSGGYGGCYGSHNANNYYVDNSGNVDMGEFSGPVPQDYPGDHLNYYPFYWNNIMYSTSYGYNQFESWTDFNNYQYSPDDFRGFIKETVEFGGVELIGTHEVNGMTFHKAKSEVIVHAEFYRTLVVGAGEHYDNIHGSYYTLEEGQFYNPTNQQILSYEDLMTNLEVVGYAYDDGSNQYYEINSVADLPSYSSDLLIYFKDTESYASSNHMSTYTDEAMVWLVEKTNADTGQVSVEEVAASDIESLVQVKLDEVEAIASGELTDESVARAEAIYDELIDNLATGWLALVGTDFYSGGKPYSVSHDGASAYLYDYTNHYENSSFDFTGSASYGEEQATIDAFYADLYAWSSIVTNTMNTYSQLMESISPVDLLSEAYHREHAFSDPDEQYSYYSFIYKPIW